MPEGPEIRRARDELAGVLEGQRVDDVFFAFDTLQPYQQRLTHQRIVSVESRGKAMLIHFDNAYTIYSHNQLYGRWYVALDKKIPDITRQLRLAIHVNAASAFLYSASDILVLQSHELAEHPYLAKLGLELLSPDTNESMVLDRLMAYRRSRRCLMGLLQDQSILSGMGNYLCCEVLHASGLHPENRLCYLDETQLQMLAHHCLQLTRQSYETSGVTNSLERAEEMKGQGVGFEDYRFRVYRRAGEVCYQCGGVVVKGKFCGRMGYRCEGCQVLSV